jgi:deoxyribodipyrimidine photo-lyase
MHRKSLFIFRRDLRLHDNSALLAASAQSNEILPLFIEDPVLLDRWSDAGQRLGFLSIALQALNQDIDNAGGKLAFASGNFEKVITDIIRREAIDAIYLNRDYTPYAQNRDRSIDSLCRKHKIACHIYADQLLNEPESVKKKNGLPYTVFTPWYRTAKAAHIAEPSHTADFRFSGTTLTGFKESCFPGLINPHAQTHCRADLLDRLGQLPNYAQDRDVPASNGTSRLSAHLRFGTISVRDVFWHAMKQMNDPEPFIRQLYWRDFYFHIAFNFPRVFRQSFKADMNDIPWAGSPALLAHWQQGTTGFPIVDAGMRELSETGYMHNRVRMITASFLVKNLHINWQAGETHFARHLIDHDPSLNNGNWQWAASTGCDAQPWFRIFNPWRQQKRFDPQCEYIRQWIPELSEQPASVIHGLEHSDAAYLPKVVDLKESASQFKDMIRSIKAR